MTGRVALVGLLACAACSSSGSANRPLDAARDDGAADSGAADALRVDARTAVDAHTAASSRADAEAGSDGGQDAPPDAGRDAGRDASQDAGSGGAHDADARPVDGPREAGASDGGDARTATEAGADARPDAPDETTLSLSLPLYPAFSTSIYDYYVKCPATSNDLVVTMTAKHGSTIALEQPITSPSSSSRTVPVTVAANGAVVVGVTSGSETTEYWVRCLPPGFPEVELTPHPDAGAATPGYYLVGTIVPETPTSGCYAIMLDVRGVPVWYQASSTGQGAIDVESMATGTISFTSYIDSVSAPPETFEIHDLPAGTTTTVVPSGGLPIDFHEFRILPNGDYVVLAEPVTMGVDLTGLGMYGPDSDVIGCTIQELTPTGTLVWEWDITDHFDPVKDSTFPMQSFVSGVNAVDPYHCNAIDVDANGDLLVSARDMDSIFLVSRQSGKVVWKMGGATYSTDDAVYITVVDDPDTSFHRQHDARFQPDGTISMFDDQTSETGPARAVVYSYDLTSATASVVWQYESTEVAEDMGSLRIQADGSRVIGWGYEGPPHTSFTELNASGNDVLDFTFTGENWTYRAVKIPISAFDIDVLRHAVGG